jgi:YebC/PmpR family DNA-binding regulatory protein
MSGHSRWNNIKRKKEKTDSKRGKIFTKIGRELTVAVKSGGPDPEGNAKLRECITKAKSMNVPNENIERIIKKASDLNLNINYESFSYEGYGPNGSAFIVDILTDNRNRTSSNLRRYFDKSGGNLGTSGCVSFMFKCKGVIVIEKQNFDEEKVMNDAINSGASDFQIEDDCFIVISDKNDYEKLNNKLNNLNYKFISSEIEMMPDSYVEIKDENIKNRAQNLIDLLEDDDDVQNVWHNCEFL